MSAIINYKKTLNQNSKEFVSKRRQLTEKLDPNYTTLRKLIKEIHRPIRKDITENNTREIS